MKTYTKVNPNFGKKSSNQQKISPVIAPKGGFFMQNLTITPPLRAMSNNLYVASNRSHGTVPENAMTPDVYSHYTSLGR